jgi:RHS repeat-associated protein
MTLQAMTVTYTLSETSGGSTNTSVSTVRFDAAEKKFTETSAESVVTLTYLNEKDRVARIEESGPSIDPLIFNYDAIGRLAEVHKGEQFIKETYDEKNRVQQTIDASGHTKKYFYDDADRVIGIILPSGKTTSKEYDDAGNLAAVVMPDKTVYRQSFNGLDQFNGFSMEGVASNLAVTYTPGGKIDKSVLSGGRESDYQYDANGRINAMNDSEISRAFTYTGRADVVGRMESTVLANPARKQAIDYKYDGSDVTEMSWTGSANGNFTYTYDGFSGLKNIRATINGETKDTPVAWDKERELTKFGPFTFNRTGPGRKVGSISDGTMNTALTYDRLGRVESMTYTISGTSVYMVKYGYDAQGRVISKTITTPEGTITDTLQYDADGQLTTVTRTGDSGGAYQEAYTYDDNRNRKTREVTGSAAETSLYGKNDTLSKVGTTEYRFDADGYLTNRGQDTFHYGPRGELLEATVGGSKVSYTYDALSRRVAREAGDQKTQYLFGNPESPHLLTDTVDTSNGASVTTHYYYNEQGLLLAFERGNTRYYVMTDGVGTPQRILQADRTVVKELRYDSYGVLLYDSAPDFKLAIGFAGGIADETSGLVRFGFRDYDPKSGRWTARDPILFDAGQANLYAYVNNNPVQLRDACGLFCIGASAYDGLGGGGKVCITDKGVSACAEAGVGLGEGLEINPFEDLSNNEISAELTGKLSAGPASATTGVKVSSRYNGDCFDISPVSKVELGPFGYDFVTPRESFIKQEAEKPGKVKGSGIKAEAALKVKACGQYKW